LSEKDEKVILILLVSHQNIPD